MAVSKVILNGETLMDVTVDTVTSEKLLTGYQATGRDGVKVQGAYVPQSVELAAGSADPSESAQHITPPSGYDGFEYFDVGAVSSDYVGSNIAQRSSSDLTASGSIVTVPSGYYAAEVSKAINAGSATTPSTTLNWDPTITVNDNGLITASYSIHQDITPNVVPGYVNSGTAGRITATGSSSKQLSIQIAATITPIESEQTAVASGKYTTGVVKVAAVPSDYVGSNVPTHDSTDLSVSGAVVTVPSGYYAAAASTTIPSGTLTNSQKQIGGSVGTVSFNSATGNFTVSRTTDFYPLTVTITDAGYFAEGSIQTGYFQINAASTSYQLNTEAAATITPTESSQVAVASGKYTLGSVTVAAIPSDYIGSAIASVEVVEGVTTVSGSSASRGVATWSAGVIASGSIGAATFANTSSGQTQYVDISNTTEAPVLVSGGYLYINKGYTDDLKISLAKLVPDGANADLSSDKILSGYAAYDNDGNLVAGNIPSKNSANVTVAGPTVSIPSGYYASAVSKTLASATLAVPTVQLLQNLGALKVTATVDSAWYAAQSSSVVHYLNTQAAATITPTETSQIAVASDKYTLGPVTVAAIPSDYIGSAIAQNSAADVVAAGPTVSIPSGYYSTEVEKTVVSGTLNSSTTIADAPTITVSDSGVITAKNQWTKNVLPVQTEGYITSNWYQIIANGSASSQLPVKDSSNLSVSGAVVTVPSGYYTAAASTTIVEGSIVVAPKTIAGYGIGTFSLDSATGIITVNRTAYNTYSQAVVQDAGYLEAGTSATALLAVASASKTYQLSTQSAATYTPSTATQTISSGVYLTGAQTIAGDTALVASNIIQGATIFGVVGTAKTQPTLQSKTVTPSSTSQVITFDSGYDGLSSVTIEAIPISVIEHRLVLPDGLIGV